MIFTHSPLLAYRMFLDPLPLWDYWALLLFPLLVGISVVYKSLRIADLRRLPVEAAKTTFWMLAGIVGVAAGVQAAIWLFS